MIISSIVSGIGSLLKRATDLIDNLTTTKEEKLTLRNELQKLQNEIITKSLEYESQLIASQSKIITSEAKGQSWLQRNWRPVTMMIFVFIIANNYIVFPYLKAIFNWGVKLEVPPDLWALLKIGLGGYVVGRSGEKIVTNLRKDK